MKIEIYKNDDFENHILKYAIIFSRYNGKWIYVKHKERKGWVAPSGHREVNEDISDAAKRELYEETGALRYTLQPLFCYSVDDKGIKNYGKVFYAQVDQLGELPESEIERIELFDVKPDDLTFPEVHKALESAMMEMLEN